MRTIAHPCRLTLPLVAALALLAACGSSDPAGSTSGAATRALTGWRADAAWDRGPAEWAVYEATRTIYGEPRDYVATLWTNTEHLDAKTGIKTDDGAARSAVRVFKHNLSEIIPAGNYDYRFLTTGYARVDDLTLMVLTMSSQEDCGATYRRFLRSGARIGVEDHCYFPGTGHRTDEWTLTDDVRFHDLLSLTLRDFDFPVDGSEPPAPKRIRLVADQTTNLAPPLRPEPATITYVGRERIELPIGTIDAHHLVVGHAEFGGSTESHYWMAADPALLHVMVRHEGPYAVRYELKDLGWWAYWSDPEPTRVDLAAPRRESASERTTD